MSLSNDIKILTSSDRVARADQRRRDANNREDSRRGEALRLALSKHAPGDNTTIVIERAARFEAFLRGGKT